jgi:hypothetical protein
MFASKYNLINHLKRLNTCQALFSDVDVVHLLAELQKPALTSGYQCEWCDKFFKHPQGRSQHKRICKNKPTNDVVQSLVQKLNELETELYEIKHGPKCPTNVTNNNTTNNTNNTNIQNNITINIKSFGCENIKHIEQDKQFLTNCLMQRDIKSLIESIHCDKEYPENHNVRIKSMKQELMETYVDGKWIITDKEETLDELINKGYRVLRLHSHRNKSDIIDECDDDDEYDDIMKWLESIYDDNKLRKPIKKQLLILFLNNKALLLGRDLE